MINENLNNVRRLMGINESKEIYFETFKAAVSYALDQARGIGYSFNQEEVFSELQKYPRARPADGETNKFSFKMYKDGKEQRKMLHVQVYNRNTEVKPYELNAYIN